MTTSRGTNLLLVGVFLLFPAALQSEEAGAGPPVTDLAGTEKWIDGPDDALDASPRRSDVAVDNKGRRIHVWAAFGVDRLDVFCADSIAPVIPRRPEEGQLHYRRRTALSPGGGVGRRLVPGDLPKLGNSRGSELRPVHGPQPGLQRQR